MSTFKLYNDDYGHFVNDRPWICGGGSECPLGNPPLVFEGMTSPEGAVRCPACAKRLGWPHSETFATEPSTAALRASERFHDTPLAYREASWALTGSIET